MCNEVGVKQIIDHAAGIIGTVDFARSCCRADLHNFLDSIESNAYQIIDQVAEVGREDCESCDFMSNILKQACESQTPRDMGLVAILKRVESGMTDVDDAIRLRSVLTFMLAMALRRDQTLQS